MARVATVDQVQNNSSRLSLAGLAGSCALLLLVLGAAALGVAVWSAGRLSSDVLLSALIGGGVCWLAGCASLAATYLGNWLHSPVHGMLAATIIRMGLPLVAIVLLPSVPQASSLPHLPGTIMGVYLVALVVETVISLRMVPSPSRAAPVA